MNATVLWRRSQKYRRIRFVYITCEDPNSLNTTKGRSSHPYTYIDYIKQCIISLRLYEIGNEVTFLPLVPWDDGYLYEKGKSKANDMKANRWLATSNIGREFRTTIFLSARLGRRDFLNKNNKRAIKELFPCVSIRFYATEMMNGVTNHSILLA